MLQDLRSGSLFTHFIMLYSFLEILTSPTYDETSRLADATEFGFGPHYLKPSHMVNYSHERVKKIEEFPRAITRAPKQSKAKQNRPLRCSNSFYKINSFEDLIISFCLFLLFDNQINTF